MNVVEKAGKALVLGLGLLLGAAVGVWLSLAVLYFLLEPAKRVSDALFVAALAALLVGIALAARRLFGRPGLIAFVLIVFVAATASAWVPS